VQKKSQIYKINYFFLSLFNSFHFVTFTQFKFTMKKESLKIIGFIILLFVGFWFFTDYLKRQSKKDIQTNWTPTDSENSIELFEKNSPPILSDIDLSVVMEEWFLNRNMELLRI
jgi:putative Mn2+ efflux pump MntP